MPFPWLKTLWCISFSYRKKAKVLKMVNKIFTIKALVSLTHTLSRSINTWYVVYYLSAFGNTAPFPRMPSLSSSSYLRQKVLPYNSPLSKHHTQIGLISYAPLNLMPISYNDLVSYYIIKIFVCHFSIARPWDFLGKGLCFIHLYSPYVLAS